MKNGGITDQHLDNGYIQMRLQRKNSGYYEVGIFCPSVHGAWLWLTLDARRKDKAVRESKEAYKCLLTQLQRIVDGKISVLRNHLKLIDEEWRKIKGIA